MSDFEPAWRDAEMDAELAAERALPTAPPATRDAIYQRVLSTSALPVTEAATSTTRVAVGLGAGPKIGIGLMVLAAIGWIALRGESPPDPVPAALPAPAIIERAAEAQPTPATDGATGGTMAGAEPVEPARPVTHRSRPKTPARAPQPPRSNLAAEQATLEGARRALAAGRPGAALEAVDRHAARFAKGQLVEERELLRVQALVRIGRHDEAAAHARRFRRRFPDSLLIEALDVASGTP